MPQVLKRLINYLCVSYEQTSHSAQMVSGAAAFCHVQYVTVVFACMCMGYGGEFDLFKLRR